MMIRAVFLALLLAFTALLSACSPTSTHVLTQSEAVRHKTVAIVEPVVTENPELDKYTDLLRSEVVADLQKAGEFAVVRNDLGPEDASISPENIAMISIELLEVDEGNGFVRVMVGFGAGSSKASAKATIKSPEGQELVSFTKSNSYGGGAFGAGGLSLVDLETLVKRLGEEIAKTVVDWNRGKTV